MNKTLKAFISLAFDCLILIIPYIILRKVDILPQSLKLIIQYGAYVIFVLSMFLAWRFNRSRVFFTSLTLLLGQLALDGFFSSGVEQAFYNYAVFSEVSILIPLNILAFSIIKERGILSSWGRMRFIFLGIELFISSWIIWYKDVDLLQLLNAAFFPYEFKLLPNFSHLSIFLFLLALIYLVLRQAITGKNFDNPFTCVLLLSFTALVLKNSELKNSEFAVPIFFTISGLLLLMVVIHVSYSMAYLDELTGLPSRRALKENMMKLGGRYSIAMLDIDHFKKFNDTHGHDVGDDVLRLVAACIKEVGGGGKAFRYGGEEFTILFPGKDINEVMPHLEELREYIANRGFIKRSKNRPRKKPKEITPKARGYKKLYLTVSIGVSERNERYRTAEEVLAASDKALYRAKSKGRNCVSK